MRYLQSNLPGPAKIYSFSLQSFVGGLNNKDQNPEETQCTSVMNMAFTDDGAMKKRHGTEYYDELDLEEKITFMDLYKPHEGEDSFIRATDKKMYMESVLIRELGGRMDGLNHSGKYIFVDTTGMFAYGIFEQTESTYVKFVGSPIDTAILLEVVDPPTTFTPLDNTHVKGVKRIDYTNRKIWYEPCKNEIEDTYKGANVLPKNPRFMVQREGRVYVAGMDDNNDTVYLSDTGNPFYFPVTISLQPPPNADRISGLSVFNNSVIIGRRDDLHSITGDTTRPDVGLPVFKLNQLNSHTGFASNQAVVNAHNYLFFLGSDGDFYALRHLDTSTDALSTQVLNNAMDVFIEPINAKMEDLWEASSVFHDDCLYTALGDKVLVYHYLHQAWTVYDQINATCFFKLPTQLFYGDKNGRTTIHSEEFLDLGKPYRAHWRTGFLDMGDPVALKMFKDFFITSRSSKEYVSNILMKFEVDYQDVDSDVDVSNEYSVYGRSKWGDRYINRDINVSLPFYIYRRGRQIRITFSNSNHITATVPTIADLLTVPNLRDGMYVLVEENNTIYTHALGEWFPLEEGDYNQGMCVLQISGEYEFKWKR